MPFSGRQHRLRGVTEGGVLHRRSGGGQREFRQRGSDVTRVGLDPAGAGAALQRQSVAQSRGHVDVDEVGGSLVGPDVLDQPGDVVALAGKPGRRVDVVERTDLVAAATRQAWIDRRREEVLLIVRRLRQDVIGRVGEMLPPAAIVPDLDRRARQDLALDGGAELPVARTHAPARHQRGIQRRGRTGFQEALVQPWAALSVERGIHQIALRHVVVVDAEAAAIAPGPGGLCHQPGDRVHRRVPSLVGRRREIFADVHLQRGLPVSEQIVGGAHSR